MPQTLTAKDLLVTEGILTCAPGETLAQALAKLNSSHDAVFVVDRADRLLGVISPYYVMYQTKYPPTTKVRNCLFHPPKLDYATPIWEIARHMAQAKVYFLPVFDDGGKWAGIVSVRRIMQAVTEYPQIERELEDRKRSRRIVTIRSDAQIDDARALLRNGGVSRLPVVDERGKLVGILTRYDLRAAFAAPLSSPDLFSRQGERRKRFSEPIRNYYKRQVVTVSHKTPLVQMINTMLEKRIGSILVVNPNWQPVEIISYRDILEAIASTHRTIPVSIALTCPEDFPDRLEAETRAARSLEKLIKWGKVQRAEVAIEATRNREDKINRYDITVRAHHTQLGTTIGNDSDYDWKTALKQAMDKVENQIRKREGI